jgi:hypothetical protein
MVIDAGERRYFPDYIFFKIESKYSELTNRSKKSDKIMISSLYIKEFKRRYRKIKKEEAIKYVDKILELKCSM